MDKTFFRILVFSLTAVSAAVVSFLALSESVGPAMTPATGVAIGGFAFAFLLVMSWTALGLEPFWIRQSATLVVAIAVVSLGAVAGPPTLPGNSTWIWLMPLGFIGLQIPCWLLSNFRRARMKLWTGDKPAVIPNALTVGNLAKVVIGMVVGILVPLVAGMVFGFSDQSWLVAILATTAVAPVFGLATASAVIIGLVLPRPRWLAVGLVVLWILCLLLTIVVHAVQGFSNLADFGQATSSVVACGLLYFVFPLYRGFSETAAPRNG